MSKSKKFKLKTSTYETITQLERELNKVAWLRLYNPTERLANMDIPEEKRTLLLLNDARYPLPRKLLSYDNEPEKWDGVFQEAIVDRLHEAICAAFSHFLDPYQEASVDLGEWVVNADGKLTGTVVFGILYRDSYGRMGQRLRLTIDLAGSRISATQRPFLDLSSVMNPFMNADDSPRYHIPEGFVRGKTLSAPHGYKGICKLKKYLDRDVILHEPVEEKKEIRDTPVSNRFGFSYMNDSKNHDKETESSSDTYISTVNADDEADERMLHRINSYMQEQIKHIPALRTLDIVKYASTHQYNIVSLGEGREKPLCHLIESYIHYIKNPEQSDITLDLIGRIWKDALKDFFKIYDGSAPEIVFSWVWPRIDSKYRSRRCLLTMSLMHNGRSIVLYVGYETAETTVSLKKLDLASHTKSIPEKSFLLARLNNLLMDALYSLDIYSSRTIRCTPRIDKIQTAFDFHRISEAVKPRWAPCFEGVYSAVVLTLRMIDSDGTESPFYERFVVYGDYPITNDNILTLSLVINPDTGMIDLSEETQPKEFMKESKEERAEEKIDDALLADTNEHIIVDFQMAASIYPWMTPGFVYHPTETDRLKDIINNASDEKAWSRSSSLRKINAILEGSIPKRNWDDCEREVICELWIHEISSLLDLNRLKEDPRFGDPAKVKTSAKWVGANRLLVQAISANNDWQTDIWITFDYPNAPKVQIADTMLSPLYIDPEATE